MIEHRQDPDPASPDPAPGIRRAALELAGTVARRGLGLTALPALALPGRLRRRVFASARLASRAGVFLPRPLAAVLEGFADDLEELEASLSRREDLGRRRRRELRRKTRRP